MPHSVRVLLAALACTVPSVVQAKLALPTTPHPLMIDAMRARAYPGSDLRIEQTLRAGVNYRRYVASYLSDGLRIRGLLTVPNGTAPAGGWPAVIFNHGYIPPEVYRTTERYVAYQDAFARAGYVTFKSDYRGHGSSQGQPRSAYWAPDYTVDVLNATASVRKYKGVNPQKIGMWGHSMGGSITLRAMVIDKGIKAGVIWGGVVATYDDLLNNWRRPGTASRPPNPTSRRLREEIVAKYGAPSANPTFWQAVSPNAYLRDLSGPLQIHHGTADATVPVAFSQKLSAQLKAVGEPHELFLYAGDNHDISRSLSLALRRSVAFFDKYLKP